MATGYSIIEYTGDGTTDTYAINFTLGYLNFDDITCRVGSEVDSSGNAVYRTITQVDGDTGRVKISGPVPANGEKIVFTRTVSKTSLEHDFSNGDTLDASALNNSFLKGIMLSHEILDGRFATFYTTLDLNGNRIVNVGDPTDNSDVATKGWAITTLQTDLSTVKAQAAAASASATAAAASATAASNAVGSVRVTNNDTTPATLSEKLLVGTGLGSAIGNAGAAETLTITPSIATDTECETGEATDKFTTPAGVTAHFTKHFADKLATTDQGAAGVASDVASTPASTAAEIAALVPGVPIGTVVAMASETVPTGYLECNGSAVSRTTYSALFAVIGTIHGTGDGSTTFNLPDYRGRFLRGWDHGAGRDPDASSRTAMATGGNTGDNVGSVQGSATSAPKNTDGKVIRGDGTVSTACTGVCGFVRVSHSGESYACAFWDKNDAGYEADARTGVYYGDNETRPINANIMYCIKY